jgi:hypothetical protein
MSKTTTQPNVELVEAQYAAFADRDMERLMDGWAADIEWSTVAGGPYGGTYTGPEAIMEHVFQPLAADWNDFRLEDKQFIDAGDTVVVTGTIRATAVSTGEESEADFAHIVTIEDGVITRFVEYADSHRIQQAL